MQSSIGNKRKWVSLPLEEAPRDSGDQAPGVGRAHSDSEPASDSLDPTSPNHTLHSNRAHDSSRSKWPALCSVHTFFFPSLVSSLLDVFNSLFRYHLYLSASFLFPYLSPTILNRIEIFFWFLLILLIFPRYLVFFIQFLLYLLDQIPCRYYAEMLCYVRWYYAQKLCNGM